MQFLRSSVSAIHARVPHRIGDVSFFLFWRTLSYLWRDFFLLTRSFFLARLFFFADAIFFFWGDSFMLARLFFLALNCRPLLDLLRA